MNELGKVIECTERVAERGRANQHVRPRQAGYKTHEMALFQEIARLQAALEALDTTLEGKITPDRWETFKRVAGAAVLIGLGSGMLAFFVLMALFRGFR